jgi:AcrR family transcriptional regulator
VTKLAFSPQRIDGRHQRSLRTKILIVEAYIDLLRENTQVPTAAQIAKRAGYSTRSVFERFSDLVELSIAAVDFAVAQGAATPVGEKANADRQSRLKFQVETRARICEDWLPLWRVLVRNQYEAEALKVRIDQVRDAIRERLKLMYRAELATLSETEREQVLIALEALTDFESWGLMRERHGLTFNDACAVWMNAIDKLLPASPPGP